MMSSIPAKNRTAEMNMDVGRLYRRLGYRAEAKAAYRAVVADVPLALEALEALASLGVPAAELSAICGYATDALPAWLGSWLRSHASAGAEIPNYKLASQQLAEVEQQLPGSVQLLTTVAEWHWLDGRLPSCIAAFTKARQADPQSLDKMGLFAHALVAEGREVPLNQLTNSLMAIDSGRAEPWIAAARLCQVRAENQALGGGGNQTGDIDKSILRTGLTLVEKAWMLAPDDLEVALTKAALLLLMGESTQAATTFRDIISRADCFEAHKGLVEAYISQERSREAVAVGSPSRCSGSATAALLQPPTSSKLWAPAIQVLQKRAIRVQSIHPAFLRVCLPPHLLPRPIPSLSSTDSQNLSLGCERGAGNHAKKSSGDRPGWERVQQV